MLPRGAVCLMLCFVLDIGSSHDVGIDKQIHNLLDRVKREFRRSEASTKEESSDNTGDIHINNLEDPDVDPNGKFIELAESFEVLEDGKKLKPTDLHPENSDTEKAEKTDFHILTHQQRVELGIESEKPGDNRETRAFATVASYWPQAIIPYEINTTSLTNYKAVPVIEEAAKIFMKNTCVKWLPHTTALEQQLGHGSYVTFHSGNGCGSYVGKVFSGSQGLSLRQPGCLTVGTALHEMGHAIGSFHEQSRTDRDNHVRINWSVLGLEQGGGNYGKGGTRDFSPYDYESIMHYGGGGPQSGIEVLQPELAFLTHSETDFSFYDIQDITDAYKCTEHCTNPPRCLNGGFLNFKCVCVCPYGLFGTSCDTVEKACGGIMNISPDEEITITTPNYPNNYDTDTECVWLLKVPANHRVRVEVDVFHLPPTDNNRCYHWLEVRYNLVGQTGIRKCGTTSGDHWVTSEWVEYDGMNMMLLIFDSVYGKNHAAEKGFSLRARAVGKGCTPDPCVNGVCKDCDDETFSCQCEPGFEGKLCDSMEASATLGCEFEVNDRCFLKNIKGDNYDWLTYSGRTATNLTGPEGAYEGDNYIYAEGSSPRTSGDTAILKSDVKIPSGDYCFTFYYNMFGADMGTLSASIENQNGSEEILSISGNQGFSWKHAEVNVSSAETFNVSIQATRGSSYESDIALDDIKLTPGMCERPIIVDCVSSPKGKDYLGTVNVTVKGYTCQRWDSNDPYSHSYHDYDEHENFCRNIRGDEPYVWCFTTDPGTRWDFCSVPQCEIEECIRSKNGYDYMGNKDITDQGKQCLPRDDGTKACRAGVNSPAPWCNIEDSISYWDTCTISKCTTEPAECIKSFKGRDYFGHVNTTKSGRTCQAWNKKEPHKHNLWVLEDQGNYCRNPDGEAGPWCFTTDQDKRYELCDIPVCNDHACRSNPCEHGGICTEVENVYNCTCLEGYEGDRCETRVKNDEDCKRTTSGYDNKGMINVTISGRTCQEWALDTPHSHGHNSLKKNYCRNPDNSPAPWCYTTDPNERFEFCDIPNCTKPAKECIESQYGENYYGTIAHTKDGIPCQSWGDQTPHAHRFGYLKDQGNFCRNPHAPGDTSPWCYTVDPNIKWGYCSIPRC